MPQQLKRINFFTPVYFEKPSSTKEALLGKIDGYFYFSGRKACVLPNQKSTVVLKHTPQSTAKKIVFGAIKVASFCTVIIPLVMLALKTALRWNYQFHSVTILSKTTPPPHELFGDVHGELVGFQENLAHAGIINKKTAAWTGGTSVIIQMGDVLDRGPLSKEVYQFLARLQNQADQAGGKVIRLLGNHELMFLQDNYGYADLNNIPDPSKMTDQMKADIKNKKLELAYSDGTRLYVHAGLRSAIREQIIRKIQERKKDSSPVTIQEIASHLNKILRDAVKRNDFSHAIFRVGKSRGGDEKVGGVVWEDIGEILDSVNARKIPQVIAHNPPRPGERPIRMTESMRLVNVDAGLCKNYGGHNAYVKLSDDKIHVVERISGLWKESVLPDRIQRKR